MPTILCVKNRRPNLLVHAKSMNDYQLWRVVNILTWRRHYLRSAHDPVKAIRIDQQAVERLLVVFGLPQARIHGDPR